MAWALSARRHIRVTAVTALLSRRGQIAFDLFAMLAVSFVGIAVWGGVGSLIYFAGGYSMADFAAPRGWWQRLQQLLK